MSTLDLTTADLIRALRPATVVPRTRPPEKIHRSEGLLRRQAADKVDARRDR